MGVATIWWWNKDVYKNLLSTVAVFQRLGVNVADLCRNILTEQNWYGDWQLFAGELKLKWFVN